MNNYTYNTLINLFPHDYLEEPVILLGIISFLLILISFPLALWSAVSSKKSTLFFNLILISNLMLASQLTLRWTQSGHFPVSNLYESLCFLTWSFTLFQLIIDKSFESPIHQAILTPFSLLIIAFASFVLPEQLQISSPLVPALRSSWLIMHVTVIMFSYAALLIGSLLAFPVLVLNRSEQLQIRSNSFGVGSFRDSSNNQELNNNLIKVMPLKFTDTELMDNLSYRIITVGFLLLTFGLISGAVWANEAWGSWWSWDPKETWALITWLVYAGYLHSRITKGWQGRRPAIIASIGLFVILVCYLGVNLLGVGLHSYGWFL